MRRIGEILRLHFDKQLGQREIARALDIGQSTVHDTLDRFAATGLGWPPDPPLKPSQLEQRLYPPKPTEPSRPLPDFEQVRGELEKPHTTLDQLWREYRENHPDGYSYSRFCALFEAWRCRQNPVMRQTYKPGEKLFADGAGDKITSTIAMAKPARPRCLSPCSVPPATPTPKPPSPNRCPTGSAPMSGH